MKKPLTGALDRSMLGVIFALAWPTMLQQLMGTAVQYIDTAMVGSLGTAATAAVGATGTVNWFIGSTVSAIGIGFLANISQAFGAGDGEKARRLSGQALGITLIVGLLFTAITLSLSRSVPVWMQVDPAIRDLAATYFFIIYTPMLFRACTIILGTVLRAAGDTHTPMRVGILVNIVNVLGNLLMIYPARSVSLLGLRFTMPGFGMGVHGAAWASALSYAVGGVAILLALWRHPKISPKRQPLKPDAELLKPCARVAFPNLLQRFGTSLGYVVFAAMINSLGETSTAAHTVANTVESLFYIPGWGMQTAAATLAGNAWGARNKEKLKTLGSAILPLQIGLMLVSGTALFLFAEPLVRIFSRDPQVIRLGTTVLRMVAVSEPFYGIPIVVEGMMQGVGHTVPPLVYNITGMWCVRILGTFVCTVLLGFGLESAWACMIGHNMLLCVMFSIRYITGRWLPKGFNDR